MCRNCTTPECECKAYLVTMGANDARIEAALEALAEATRKSIEGLAVRVGAFERFELEQREKQAQL